MLVFVNFREEATPARCKWRASKMQGYARGSRVATPLRAHVRKRHLRSHRARLLTIAHCTQLQPACHLFMLVAPGKTKGVHCSWRREGNCPSRRFRVCLENLNCRRGNNVGVGFLFSCHRANRGWKGFGPKNSTGTKLCAISFSRWDDVSAMTWRHLS